jgi:hypothetical protein
MLGSRNKIHQRANDDDCSNLKLRTILVMMAAVKSSH